MKKYYIGAIIGFLFAVVGFVPITHAALPTDQTDDSGGYYSDAYDATQGIFQEVGDGWSGDSQYWYVKMHPTGTQSQIYGKIYEFTNADCSTGLIRTSSTATTTNWGDYIRMDMGDSFAMNASYCYVYMVGNVSACPDHVNGSGCAQFVKSDGIKGDPFYGSGDGYEMYYYNGGWESDQDLIYLTFTTPDASVPDVEVAYPYDSGTSTSRFTHFHVDVEAIGTTTYQVGVLYGEYVPVYGTAGSQFWYTNGAVYALPPGATTTHYIPKEFIVENYGYAQAILYYGNLNNILGTSSIVHWTVEGDDAIFTNFESGYFEPPDEEDEQIAGFLPCNDTSSIFYVDCTAYDDGTIFDSSTIAALGCAMQKSAMCIAEGLFKPSSESVNGLVGEMDVLKSSFPFTYFYGVNTSTQEAILGLDGSSDVDLVLYNVDGTSTIKILSSSTLEQATSSAFKNWWFNFVLMMFDVAALALVLRVGWVIVIS